MTEYPDRGDSLDWARRIMRRVEAGDRTVTPTIRLMAEDALGIVRVLKPAAVLLSAGLRQLKKQVEV
jgi:hypothetical protein